MQLIKRTRVFDAKKVEQTLITENKFITDLFSVLCLPNRDEDTNEEDVEEQKNVSNGVSMYKNNDKTRAKSLTELQERLHAITSKKKLTYKDKLAKKNLKNRMKKKTKQDERNAQQKLMRAQKLTNLEKSESDSSSIVKTAKPVYNSEGKMVFSKFDFSNLGNKKEKKLEKDPKKLLKNLEQEKEKFNELKESGEIEKAFEIKDKTTWKNALAKAEGKKVKDDPVLLKKTVQKQEQKKRASKKKWKARIDKVEKSKQERQNKRTENIEKRKKEKNKKKLKKAVKKGKIIPGF